MTKAYNKNAKNVSKMNIKTQNLKIKANLQYEYNYKIQPKTKL